MTYRLAYVAATLYAANFILWAWRLAELAVS